MFCLKSLTKAQHACSSILTFVVVDRLERGEQLIFAAAGQTLAWRDIASLFRRFLQEYTAISLSAECVEERLTLSVVVRDLLAYAGNLLLHVRGLLGCITNLLIGNVKTI